MKDKEKTRRKNKYPRSYDYRKNQGMTPTRVWFNNKQIEFWDTTAQTYGHRFRNVLLEAFLKRIVESDNRDQLIADIMQVKPEALKP